jgi:hypothetical protein
LIGLDSPYYYIRKKSGLAVDTRHGATELVNAAENRPVVQRRTDRSIPSSCSTGLAPQPQSLPCPRPGPVRRSRDEASVVAKVPGRGPVRRPVTVGSTTDSAALADCAEDLRTVRHLASTAPKAVVELAQDNRHSPLPWLDCVQSAGIARQCIIFRGQGYDVWLHRPLPDNAEIGCGSLSEDSCGRWYINVRVEVPEATQAI